MKKEQECFQRREDYVCFSCFKEYQKVKFRRAHTDQLTECISTEAQTNLKAASRVLLDDVGDERDKKGVAGDVQNKANVNEQEDLLSAFLAMIPV